MIFCDYNCSNSGEIALDVTITLPEVRNRIFLARPSPIPREPPIISEVCPKFVLRKFCIDDNEIYDLEATDEKLNLMV